jgi:hypothetical protein
MEKAPEKAMVKHQHRRPRPRLPLTDSTLPMDRASSDISGRVPTLGGSFTTGFCVELSRMSFEFIAAALVGVADGSVRRGGEGWGNMPQSVDYHFLETAINFKDSGRRVNIALVDFGMESSTSADPNSTWKAFKTELECVPYFNAPPVPIARCSWRLSTMSMSFKFFSVKWWGN